MRINSQRYAFFDYSKELEDMCKQTLSHEYSNVGNTVIEPNMIRVNLRTMEYICCKAALNGLQRPRLEPWVLDSLLLISSPTARELLVTELYDENG